MKLNHLFSDGAIFQRRQSIAVFGTAEPYAILDIEFAGKTFTGGCGIDGSFLIRMSPFEAGGPYTMKITSRKSGESMTVRDILVGEVWIAGGQSNMEFSINASPAQKQEFIENGLGHDAIRMYTVPRRASTAPENDVAAAWLKSDDPGKIGGFSAVALWFARKIYEKTGVPVGILNSNRGATIAQAWTSRSTLIRNPDMQNYVREYESAMTRGERWADMTLDAEPPAPIEGFADGLCDPEPPNDGVKNHWADLDYSDTDWTDFAIPGSWIGQKLSSHGTIWIRKTLELPASWAGKDLILHLGGIDKHDTTYFNGEQVGRTGEKFELKYWNTPRVYKIPGKCVKAGKNVVAIRAFTFLSDGSFNGKADAWYLELPGTAERISVAGSVKFKAEHEQGKQIMDEHYSVGGSGPWFFNSPYILFDSMIRPLIPYTIRGVIWYQGESNRTRPRQYKRLIKDMICDWRFHWGQGDFPFLQVQLANFRAVESCDSASCWAVIRQAQLESTRELPNCGMSVTIDIGSEKEIHPLNKKDVGYRLADWALKNTYHLAGTRECSPLPREIRYEGEKIRILFDNAETGLVLRKAEQSGFYIAEENTCLSEKLRYLSADAVVEGASIVLSHKDLRHPTRVRYAWADNPQYVTLYNGDGIPASPFEF